MAASVPLPASVTMHEASEVLRRLEAALPAIGEGLEIDAAALRAFDTSLLAVLLQVLRSAQARGVGVRLAHAPAKLASLAALYGVESLLPLPPAEPARPGST